MTYSNQFTGIVQTYYSGVKLTIRGLVFVCRIWLLCVMLQLFPKHREECDMPSPARESALDVTNMIKSSYMWLFITSFSEMSGILNIRAMTIHEGAIYSSLAS